ncbi:glyceraldehyde-3-phosphate dehydrogenase-like [Zalophus californianus]|uniref:Glyceraldehyde-3-phosphate dehydrogenase n=1 Tax=Zalophus californianus TaxID=9704 RepID=A0A6P9EVI4_ZALCA|nr:glyceraldehyde-3-phosphate dehydrogenase-like [Zalophus californianus]
MVKVGYDSTHGKLKGTVKAEKSNPVISAKPISIFQEQDPTNIEWGDAGDEYAVESTGEGCSLLEGGAKKISISAHSTDALIFAMGVNHEKYDNSLKIVSNASCSTNCLSSLAKVIHYNNGIVEELMTTVHAITATKKTMPGPARKLWHDSWGASQNIIPASTYATKAVVRVIPELNRKLTSMAFHVLAPKVSVVDLSCHLGKTAKYYDIKKLVKQALKGPLKSILGPTEDQVVSCNFKNDTQSSTFNAGAVTVLNDHLVKFIF